LIDGVVITSLKQIRDERGAVLHMLRTDAPHFAGFGEVYFSIVNPGVIKGWRRHTKMTMSLTVPKGRVKLVLADGVGAVQEIVLGEDEVDYQLVTVPPMVWNGFQCISSEPAIIANCASIPHAPDEAERIPLDSSEIEYSW
jgi:dTDP-4-dehydrorhamnose 3,5-epimerase